MGTITSYISIQQYPLQDLDFFYFNVKQRCRNVNWELDFSYFVKLSSCLHKLNNDLKPFQSSLDTTAWTRSFSQFFQMFTILSSFRTWKRAGIPRLWKILSVFGKLNRNMKLNVRRLRSSRKNWKRSEVERKLQDMQRKQVPSSKIDTIH